MAQLLLCMHPPQSAGGRLPSWLGRVQQWQQLCHVCSLPIQLRIQPVSPSANFPTHPASQEPASQAVPLTRKSTREAGVGWVSGWVGTLAPTIAYTCMARDILCGRDCTPLVWIGKQSLLCSFPHGRQGMMASANPSRQIFTILHCHQNWWYRSRCIRWYRCG